jgi:OmpA-OmpF porin, OOP family
MKNVKRISLLASVLVLSLLGYSEVRAQDGFYLGGSMGPSYINKKFTDIDQADLNLEGKELAYKIYAGYKIPGFLALEGGYRNLGSVAADLADYNNFGWDVSAKGDISIGPLQVFAKAGAYFNNVNVTFQNPLQPDINKNNTKFLFGFGAGLNIQKLGLRAEWESLDFSKDSKVSMLTAGITYSFSGGK